MCFCERKNPQSGHTGATFERSDTLSQLFVQHGETKQISVPPWANRRRHGSALAATGRVLLTFTAGHVSPMNTPGSASGNLSYSWQPWPLWSTSFGCFESGWAPDASTCLTRVHERVRTLFKRPAGSTEHLPPGAGQRVHRPDRWRRVALEAVDLRCFGSLETDPSP